MKILFLEDNSTDTDLIKRGLIESIPDCIIEHASTVEQARKHLNANLLFDIALLDVNLPDGNGLEFLIEIRQRELNFPVIMLTGSGDEDAAVTALKTGANDYIVKRPGFILHLPDIINLAITNFKENDLYTSEVIHILYIEHHAIDIDFTIRHLALYAPYIHTDTVATAEEALSRLEKGTTDPLKYKVILMDYRLPGMDALELIKTIRQKLKLCIPIILVTGQGNEELAVQAMKLGANDYLTKSERYLFRLPSVIVNSFQHCELKRKQDALVESESKYRLLADNSGDVIFVLDMNLNYTYISPAVEVMRGFKPEEAIKQKISEVLTPDSYLKTVKVISDILSEKSISQQNSIQQKSIELEMIRKDNTTVWVEVKASLITDKNNEPLGILGVSRDISERKKMIDALIATKEKIEESDRLKSAFLLNLSHEIRTPMNGILGFAQLLKEPHLTFGEQEKFIQQIEKSSTRMLNIITAIVNISKIESGQIEMYISETNINKQIEFVYNFFKPAVEQKGVQLLVGNTVSSQETIIQSDSEKILSILNNLVDNAVKFTHTGSIEFGYERKGEYLKFFVKDTGDGIPKEKKTIIFERFRQGSESLTRNYEGAGLGLSISKAYVEMLGGKIWVESELGIGSTFYFTIPCNAETESEVILKKPASTKNKNSTPKNLKILIVEDDESSELFLSAALEKNKNEIFKARNGIDAVETCRNNPDIDLVLMDVRMSGMDGYEATRKIREFNKDLIIIAQTAYGLSGDREKAIGAGCNDYISKPIDIALIKALILKHFK